MYRRMADMNYNNAEEAIAAVRLGIDSFSYYNSVERFEAIF
jgi:hypothetical protein